MNNHKKIIATLQKFLEPIDSVHALWLEGSYSQGTSDQYSDLDIWAEVDLEAIPDIYQKVREALSTIGPLDIEFEMHKTNEQRHFVYHIADDSEFSTIDVNIQPFPWPSELEEGVDQIEIIFNKDKKFITKKTLVEFDEAKSKKRILEFYMVQRPNVLKNIFRKKPLEAKKYYDSIVEMGIKFLRRRSRLDAKMGFGLKHVYCDLEKKHHSQIEYFVFVKPEELEVKLTELHSWLESL